MKDEEKQIEEMAKVMCGGCYGGQECMRGLCAAWYNAEKLYNADYRKLLKDNVVLSVDEFANLKKYAYKKGCKETAENIINPLLDIEVIDEDYKQFFLDVCGKLEELADKHDVEIKE